MSPGQLSNLVASMIDALKTIIKLVAITAGTCTMVLAFVVNRRIQRRRWRSIRSFFSFEEYKSRDFYLFVFLVLVTVALGSVIWWD